MTREIRCAFIGLFLALTSVVAHAGFAGLHHLPVPRFDWQKQNNNLGIYAMAENMSYTEYDYFNGTWSELDSETGTLPGFGINGSYQGRSGKVPYWFALDLNLIGGDTTYDGYLINLDTYVRTGKYVATPYQSSTTNSKVNTLLKLGIPYSPAASGGNGDWQIIPYLSLGGQYWSRGLDDKTEVYTNYPLGIGARWQYHPGERWVIEADGSYAGMLRSSMKISDQGFDQSLGHNPVLNLGLKGSYRLNPDTGIFLGYNYQRFDYDQSDAQSIQYAGKTLYIYEPESKTRLNQFQLGVQFFY